MPTLTVISRDGSSRDIAAAAGHSLKDVLLDNGFDEILALCGGCLSCATCHVHVAADHHAALPPMSPDEDDLLDSVPDRDADSRLSCQLPVTEAFAGMTVTIGEEG